MSEAESLGKKSRPTQHCVRRQVGQQAVPTFTRLVQVFAPNPFLTATLTATRIN